MPTHQVDTVKASQAEHVQEPLVTPFNKVSVLVVAARGEMQQSGMLEGGSIAGI